MDGASSLSGHTATFDRFLIMPTPLKTRPVITLAGLLLLGLMAYGGFIQFDELQSPPSNLLDAPAESVESMFEQRTSGEMVVFEGLVTRLLADDNDGSRHQRFILTTKSGQTILIAHNIDLARRVPVALGDKVLVYGQYEWNERGGVVHWTHRDPQNRHPHGWIEHRGNRYD